METTSLKTIKNGIRHWYLLLIAGLLYMVVGTWVFLTPLNSYLALAALFSIAFIATGISEIIFSISKQKKLDSRGWKLALGMLTALIGLIFIGILGLIFSYALIWDSVFVELTLVYWTGLSLITFGIYSIYFSMQLNKLGKKLLLHKKILSHH